MHYMGGKFQIAGPIARLIQDQRQGGALPYIEPFVGAANILARVPGGVRIASDLNAALICLLSAVRDGWLPPERLSRPEWDAIKARMDENDPMTGFAGICCSFSGHYWTGYIDTNKRTSRPYAEAGRNTLQALAPLIQGVEFRACDYRDHDPQGAVIYCDPPYAGVTGYFRGGFSSPEFWDRVRHWVRRGNRVLVSEYQAPPDFVPIWSRQKVQGMRKRTAQGLVNPRTIERVFMHASQAGIGGFYPPEQAEIWG